MTRSLEIILLLCWCFTYFMCSYSYQTINSNSRIIIVIIINMIYVLLCFLYIVSPTESLYKKSASFPRRIMNWICGIDAASKNKLSSHKLVVNDMLSINETSNSRILTAIMASALAAVGCFLLGFFAWILFLFLLRN